MATGEFQVDVSLEAALHRRLRESAEAIQREYGLRVTSVEFEWIDTGGIGGPSGHRLIDVQVVSRS